MYLSRVQRVVGDWIVFHELYDRGRGAAAYVSFAKVTRIEPDPARDGYYYARLSEAGSFAQPIPVADQPEELKAGFNRQNAVRIITNEMLEALFRISERSVPMPDQPASGFAEEQTPFGRDFQETIRAKREPWFRERVLTAYDFRCALTGMRLVNGGGASEVEAAHIQSVKDGGPDLIQNGLALSRTVHWMFDRHLITFSDDLSLIRTPMLSDEASRFIGNVTALNIPVRAADAPNLSFVAHHRIRTMGKSRDYLANRS